MPELTNDQKRQQYDDKITVLKEEKKLGMLTQDQYDKRHKAIVE